jgi:hypothetical protein
MASANRAVSRVSSARSCSFQVSLDAAAVPLSAVEKAWPEPGSGGRRIVFVP